MTATATTTITIPVDLYNVIRDLATSTKQTEIELMEEALQAYRREEMRLQFRSFGTAWDDELTGTNSEDWLRENWNPDERG